MQLKNKIIKINKIKKMQIFRKFTFYTFSIDFPMTSFVGFQFLLQKKIPKKSSMSFRKVLTLAKFDIYRNEKETERI